MKVGRNDIHTKLAWVQVCMIVFCFTLMSSVWMTIAWAVEPLEDGSVQKVFDQAGLFTESQAEALEERTAQIAEEAQYDIAIVTTNHTGSMVTYEYAEYFYETYEIGYGDNKQGFLLLIDMDNRQIYIDEYNALEENFQLSTSERDAILDVIMEYAYDGDFYGVADSFLDELPQYLNNGISGDADYQYAIEHGEPDQQVQEPLTFPEAIKESLPMAALVALAVAGITLIVLVVMQKTGSGASAAEYQKGALRIYRRSDVFVNTTVTKHKIETSSSSGGGGGSSHHGGGHSGGGRSF